MGGEEEEAQGGGGRSQKMAEAGVSRGLPGEVRGWFGAQRSRVRKRAVLEKRNDLCA